MMHTAVADASFSAEGKTNWDADHSRIVSTYSATNATGPIPITVTHGVATLNAEKCEVTCDNDNDADIASIPAGSAGQVIDVVVTAVVTSTTNTFTLTGTFSGGATSITFPAIGQGLIGRGVRLIWSVTESAWTIDNFYNEWPAEGIEVHEATAKEPTPIAGVLQTYAKSLATKMYPAFTGPSGAASLIQPHFGRNTISMARGVMGTGTPGAFGMTLTGTGTLTAPTWAVTNKLTQSMRSDYRVTTAATSAVAGWRAAASAFWRSNVAGRGGFFFQPPSATIRVGQQLQLDVLWGCPQTSRPLRM